MMDWVWLHSACSQYRGVMSSQGSTGVQTALCGFEYSITCATLLKDQEIHHVLVRVVPAANSKISILVALLVSLD